MTKKFLLLFFILANIVACAQNANDVINSNDVQRIESALASDAMRGRRAGTTDIDRAASFIVEEFKKAGLQPLQGNSFLQEFTMLRPRMISLKYEENGQEANTKNVIVITSEADLKVDEKSDYEIQSIAGGDNLFQKAQSIRHSNKNIIAFVDTGFAKNFTRLLNFKRQMFKSETNTIFILGSKEPKEFKIKAEHSLARLNMRMLWVCFPAKAKRTNT